jgi:hypothetical protein
VGKAEGKRPLGRPRNSWESGIRIDDYRGMEWIQLAKDRNRFVMAI